MVTSGHYEIEAHWDNGQGGSQDISKAIIVTGGGGAAGTLTVMPNIVTPSSGTSLVTFLVNSPNAMTLKVSIYDVAGELVKVVLGTGGTNQAAWDASGVASGVYIARVDALNGNGGLAQRQMAKILVLH
jgi:hypothetical protein